ncbi:MAG TPA: acetyl-CoA C-acetyltransferase [candidate division Zixibacteria bacterium]|nr:acetyl-CoA C-acetyltransferase [candidate division Zixibacteria bacterium]
MSRAVIVSAVRTPIGSFNGSLAPLSAPRLGSVAIAGAVKSAGLTAREVDQVIMGTVLAAGQGQAPARQAGLGAGLPPSVGCVTVNKVCGSGLQAVIFAAQAIQCGDAETVAAGGMESMSNAPYLLEKARSGYRMGHGALIDSMIKDGLWDVYNDFHMGEAAERCAEEFNISRAEQDEFAIASYTRAQSAQEQGGFAREIVPVRVAEKGGNERVVGLDEELQKFDPKKLIALKPAFRENGTVTAGNASSVSDGAAALIVMAEHKAAGLGLDPLARIVAWSGFSRQPEWFTIAPADAIMKLLERCGLTADDIDLFEINEAFSAASIAVNRKLGLDPAKVNVKGGAVALGHPIGASGARILTTLVHSLVQYKKRRGIAALCIGGGEALALLVERG